ncbi:MAG: hypothetical protein IJO33_02910 [Bacilli bacterium]|nr:hypothetical protein [Bacilli bacterium]
MQDDVKINVVTLEDGKEYYEIKRLLLDDNDYLILSAVEGEDFAVRKLIKKEGQEDLFISKLDSEEEVQKVLKTFLDSFNI